MTDEAKKGGFKAACKKIFRVIGNLAIAAMLLFIGTQLTVQLDDNYQAGSAQKLDDCERLLARDINCVLVAVEDEP